MNKEVYSSHLFKAYVYNGTTWAYYHAYTIQTTMVFFLG